MELTNKRACRIFGFHSGFAEDSVLLGCDTVTGFMFLDILK